MTEILIMIGIICISLLLIRYLPSRKSILYVLLGIGIIPIFYFYAVKYYYVDNAANTAGAYILFSAMCTTVLFNEFKQIIPKYEECWKILQVTGIVAAACYLFIYKSKVSFLALVLFILMIIPNLIKKIVLRNKTFYGIFTVLLLLGSIAVRIITHGNHDGLTYVYSNGGVFLFLITLSLIVYWLLSQFEYAGRNRNSEIVLACNTVCMVLLWLNPCMIQGPLVLFLLVFGYAIRNVEYDNKDIGLKFAVRKSVDSGIMNCSKKDKNVIGLLLYVEFAIAVIILGPLEIFAGNSSELYFGMKSFLPYIVLITILVGAIYFIILKFITGKFFGIITTALFSIEIAMYVQTMFMNIKLWETNGSAMNWDSVSWFVPINSLIWLGIIVICLILCVSTHGKNIVKYATSFMIIVQISAICFVLVTSINSGKKVNSVFSSETEYELAKDDNIIVFVLDCLARDYMDDVRKESPDILDDWHDFTEFRNANSDCARTYPSITHMITGYEYDEYERAWRSNAWNSGECSRFIDMLHNSGYTFNVFSKEILNIGDYYEVNGKVDNIIIQEPKIDSIKTTLLLLKASIYRELPYVIKPYFEVYSWEYDEVAEFNSTCPFQNYDYYNYLKNDGLKVSESIENQLAITHIIGVHGPRCSNERAEYVDNSSYEDTTRGLVFIIDEYLSQLKALGKYDETTIIITADHSDNMSHPQPIYFIKQKNEHHDTMQVSNAPISHSDFQGTVAEIITQKKNTLNRKSIWDIKEDSIRKRILQGETWDGIKNTFFCVEYEGAQEELVDQLRDEGIIE